MEQKNKILGVVTVTSAGTKQRLTSTSTSVYAIEIQADKDNVGSVYIGDSTLTTSNGIELEPKDIHIIELEEMDELNLSDYYVDADNNDDKIRVHYLTVRGV